MHNVISFKTAILNFDHIAAVFERLDEKRKEANQTAYIAEVRYKNGEIDQFELPEGKRLKDML